MDSQSSSFESPLPASSPLGTEAGTPLRCPRTMRAQAIVVATPVSLAGSLVTALLAVPRALMLAPELLRVRQQRRA